MHMAATAAGKLGRSLVLLGRERYHRAEPLHRGLRDGTGGGEKSRRKREKEEKKEEKKERRKKTEPPGYRVPSIRRKKSKRQRNRKTNTTR